MAIVWTPNLSVGVEHIDEQHKIWFEKANGLFEASKERRAKDYIDTMLNFLDEYTKEHFRDEEAYMEKIGYPEIDAQKKAHASFVQDLAKLKSDYNESGGNILVIINANKMVVNWLTNHITTMDKKIGDYVRVVMCCYPTPSIGLLGKISKVEDIFESIGSVKLSRWGINVGIYFIEKVEDNNDIEMELNENTIFNPFL